MAPTTLQASLIQPVTSRVAEELLCRLLTLADVEFMSMFAGTQKCYPHSIMWFDLHRTFLLSKQIEYKYLHLTAVRELSCLLVDICSFRDSCHAGSQKGSITPPCRRPHNMQRWICSPSPLFVTAVRQYIKGPLLHPLPFPSSVLNLCSPINYLVKCWKQTSALQCMCCNKLPHNDIRTFAWPRLKHAKVIRPGVVHDKQLSMPKAHAKYWAGQRTPQKLQDTHITTDIVPVFLEWYNQFQALPSNFCFHQ